MSIGLLRVLGGLRGSKAVVKVLNGIIALAIFGVSHSAHAIPGRSEVYRNTDLGIVVYKDRNDTKAFWYVPPVRLYEDEGKVVYYKRDSGTGDRVSFVFYIVPYMTKDLKTFLRGEIPGFQNGSDLKEVQAKNFGIQVKQFGVISMGEKITDFKYLNQPHPVVVTLSKDQAQEFEFFIRHKPGVQANVLIDYETEKMDKDLTIKITYQQLHDRLVVGGAARYKFAQAEIAKAVESLVADQAMLISGKGDLQIPDVMKEVIRQCFDPVPKTSPRRYEGGSRYDEDSYYYNVLEDDAVDQAAANRRMEELGLELPNIAEDDQYGVGVGVGADPQYRDEDPPGGGGDPVPMPTGGKPGKDRDGVFFMLKQEKVSADKNCFFRQEHFVDSSEVVGIPVYLTLLPISAQPVMNVSAIESRKVVVGPTNIARNALSTGIIVKENEQYIIDAAFSAAASTAFRKGWLIWDYKEWKTDPSSELYYRVGNSQWTPVNGRALIKSDEMYHGEIQLYLDRERIWSKIPAKEKGWGKLNFDGVLPMFNVTISGTRVEHR